MSVKKLPQATLPLIPKENIAQFGLNAMDRPSILVVEDTTMCARLLCKMLETLQCTSTWVKDGQEAVDILRSSPPNMHNLILMDIIRMPILDGISANRGSHQEPVETDNSSRQTLVSYLVLRNLLSRA